MSNTLPRIARFVSKKHNRTYFSVLVRPSVNGSWQFNVIDRYDVLDPSSNNNISSRWMEDFSLFFNFEKNCSIKGSESLPGNFIWIGFTLDPLCHMHGWKFNSDILQVNSLTQLVVERPNASEPTNPFKEHLDAKGPNFKDGIMLASKDFSETQNIVGISLNRDTLWEMDPRSHRKVETTDGPDNIKVTTFVELSFMLACSFNGTTYYSQDPKIAVGGSKPPVPTTN